MDLPVSQKFPNIAKSLISLIVVVGFIGFLFFFLRTNPAPQEGYQFGLIGNDGLNLEAERRAGISLRLFSLSWQNLIPTEGRLELDYLNKKRAELAELRDQGFSIILSLGLHDTPSWLHENYENSYFLNQFGTAYMSEEHDAGTANLVFNQELRGLAIDYMETVFYLFGTDFYAVRVGGGRYGELSYPPATYAGENNNYWAFDANALALSPVPDWKPSEVAANGEAEAFLRWYLAALSDYQNWQIASVRQFYLGDIMVLYPSWGIRPGDIEAALDNHLDGSSSAEINGEIQRGFAFEEQIASITDPNVIVTTTWLDADSSQDDGDDPRYWSPVKYLSMLAQNHPLRLHLFGENTGRGTLEDMQLSVAQMQRYELLGMLWFRDEELSNPDYASLDDYRDLIVAAID